MDQQGRAWNMALILDTFSQKDAEIILKLKPNADQADEVCWGFSKNRDYTTKSGYAVLDAIEELNLPHEYLSGCGLYDGSLRLEFCCLVQTADGVAQVQRRFVLKSILWNGELTTSGLHHSPVGGGRWKRWLAYELRKLCSKLLRRFSATPSHSLLMILPSVAWSPRRPSENGDWSTCLRNQDRNSVASQIALSVLRDGRLQSYIALGGPS
ncbi:hypothetical protein IGI04_014105 [Brassica rapa subsp. trilocularis]|uniref:Uncharacterized protein n=1 Tax=Brassica rapa subsp. trilocularis TaxID=1813537 RepID=A0ABQ7ML80_BRACM|nr:hypothetical protein IGI04_014105 [Brassica rapa subsp. trilocularis]